MQNLKILIFTVILVAVLLVIFKLRFILYNIYYIKPSNARNVKRNHGKRKKHQKVYIQYQILYRFIRINIHMINFQGGNAARRNRQQIISCCGRKSCINVHTKRANRTLSSTTEIITQRRTNEKKNTGQTERTKLIVKETTANQNPSDVTTEQNLPNQETKNELQTNINSSPGSLAEASTVGASDAQSHQETQTEKRASSVATPKTDLIASTLSQGSASNILTSSTPGGTTSVSVLQPQGNVTISSSSSSSVNTSSANLSTQVNLNITGSGIANKSASNLTEKATSISVLGNSTLTTNVQSLSSSASTVSSSSAQMNINASTPSTVSSSVSSSSTSVTATESITTVTSTITSSTRSSTKILITKPPTPTTPKAQVCFKD
jgi:hypothetical protein